MIVSNQNQEIKLGFLDSTPDTLTYIYVGATENSCWYFFETETNTKIAIAHKALAGYLEVLKVSTKEFKEKKQQKLDILIKGDKRYCVRSGLDTNFSRGLLLALANLSPEHLLKPIIIAPKLGQDTIFASVFDEAGSRVKFDWNADTSLLVLVEKINSLLGVKTEFKQSSTEISEPLTKQTPAHKKFHPNNVLIKRIRTALGYEANQIIEWLNTKGYSSPDLAPKEVVDELIETLCASWAMHNKYFADFESALKSYQEFLSLHGNTEEIHLLWIEEIQKPVVTSKEAIPF
jgi:hypothetical protein